VPVETKAMSLIDVAISPDRQARRPVASGSPITVVSLADGKPEWEAQPKGR